ncbi:MAG TPA: LLM class F420-dependent oxidoreductase [Acidimicrobiales bacterium]|nr:LLM class F420-dependent oxidoreductase [Acidimicrobiales bacterium]
MDLGRFGIWSGQFRSRHAERNAEAARRIEELGYGALWIPGGAGGEIFGDVTNALAATDRLIVATGILNVWAHEPAEAAAGHAEVGGRFPGRFLLGLGISHAMLVESIGATYDRPLIRMRAYLDALDAADPPVPADQRVLAALGPKMLELAGERTAGAHPYFTTPEHTAIARAALGAGPLLAPEQMVVLETDAGTAREVARQAAAIYLNLPNYTNNLRRLGWGDDDLAPPGSDRLIDAVVTWGSAETIAGRVAEHHDAGADHVCIQVLTADPGTVPTEQWAEVAGALGL